MGTHFCFYTDANTYNHAHSKSHSYGYANRDSVTYSRA
jgi:hypothetical protein